MSDLRTLKTADLVRILKVARETLSRWLAAGRLPQPLRLVGGRGLRWRREEIEAWLAAGMPPRKEWEAIQARRAGKR